MCRAPREGGIETKTIKSGDVAQVINIAKFRFDSSSGFSFMGIENRMFLCMLVQRNSCHVRLTGEVLEC